MTTPHPAGALAVHAIRRGSTSCSGRMLFRVDGPVARVRMDAGASPFQPARPRPWRRAARLHRRRAVRRRRGFGLITAGSGGDARSHTQFIGGGSDRRAARGAGRVLRETGRLLFLRGLVVQGDDEVAASPARLRDHPQAVRQVSERPCAARYRRAGRGAASSARSRTGRRRGARARPRSPRDTRARRSRQPSWRAARPQARRPARRVPLGRRRRGKSMLMDLFFAHVDIAAQAPRPFRRVHDGGPRAHRAPSARKEAGDPIAAVAAAHRRRDAPARLRRDDGQQQRPTR